MLLRLNASQQRIYMKSFLLISLLTLTAVGCGKKANFDGRDVPAPKAPESPATPTSPSGDGVGTAGLELKETRVTIASIDYTSRTVAGRTDSFYGLNSTGVTERYFVKVPTSLTVTNGHSSNSSGKAVLTLSSVDGVVECTYFGQSTLSNPTPSANPEEWSKGQSYAGVVCKEDGVVNAEITSGSAVEVTQSVRLSVQSAHTNASNTQVRVSLEYYQPE